MRSLLAEGCAGYGAGAATDAVFYLLDSYKVQKQMNHTRKLDIRQMSRGLISLSATGSAPSIATFFLLYAPFKNHMEGSGYTGTGVLLGAAIAAVPASFVAVPADVVKKQVLILLTSRDCIVLDRCTQHIYLPLF